MTGSVDREVDQIMADLFGPPDDGIPIEAMQAAARIVADLFGSSVEVEDDDFDEEDDLDEDEYEDEEEGASIPLGRRHSPFLQGSPIFVPFASAEDAWRFMREQWDRMSIGHDAQPIVEAESPSRPGEILQVPGRAAEDLDEFLRWSERQGLSDGMQLTIQSFTTQRRAATTRGHGVDAPQVKQVRPPDRDRRLLDVSRWSCPSCGTTVAFQRREPVLQAAVAVRPMREGPSMRAVQRLDRGAATREDLARASGLSGRHLRDLLYRLTRDYGVRRTAPDVFVHGAGVARPQRPGLASEAVRRLRQGPATRGELAEVSGARGKRLRDLVYRLVHTYGAARDVVGGKVVYRLADHAVCRKCGSDWKPGTR